MPKNKKIKIIKAWAGFCEDELDYGWEINDKVIPIYSIYKTKKEALLHFQDVRKVTITLASPHPHQKKR